MRHHAPDQLAENRERQPTRFASSDPAAAVGQTPNARGGLGSFLLQLQRSHGNRYVQRLVERRRPALGTGIPDGIRSTLERRSGVDLSDVRVHYNSPQPARLDALAYTQGSEIHVAAGQEAHLAHEAWHVVQQRQGRVRATRTEAGVPLNDNANLEREADRAGQASFAAPVGSRSDLSPSPAPHTSQPAPVQRFWVFSNGQYRWEPDQTRKEMYHRTNATRQTFWHPSPHRLYIDPWEPDSTSLQIENAEVGVKGKKAAKLKKDVINVLETIRQTTLGALLLRALATAAGKTTIHPRSEPTPPEARIKRSDPNPIIKFHPDAVNGAELLRKQHRTVEERVAWDPIPPDVALFHELVHAYYAVIGGEAQGVVTGAQAIHPGDKGVNMLEYQAVGLDTRDGDRFHSYSREAFTENRYREAINLPRRTAYTIRSRREYSESSHQSMSRSFSGSSRSSSESQQKIDSE